MIVSVIEKIYAFLWGDLITIPLPQESSIGISLLVILLIPTGIYFTIRTRFLPVRLFPDMIKALMAKKETKDSLSTFQTLIVSTATRVGMGNLVGVVAARHGAAHRDGTGRGRRGLRGSGEHNRAGADQEGKQCKQNREGANFLIHDAYLPSHSPCDECASRPQQRKAPPRRQGTSE